MRSENVADSIVSPQSEPKYGLGDRVENIPDTASHRAELSVPGLPAVRTTTG